MNLNFFRIFPEVARAWLAASDDALDVDFEGEVGIHCGRGVCAAWDGHAGACDEASGWVE